MIIKLVITGLIIAGVYLAYTKVPKINQFVKDAIKAIKVKFGW